MASSASKPLRRLPLALLLAAALPAGAATTCRMQAGGHLAFGPYDILSPAPTDSLERIHVTCERQGGPQKLGISMQLGTSQNGGSVANRRLQHLGGSTDALAYNLYRDASRTAVWGFTDGVDTVVQPVEIPNKDQITVIFTIYGRIPARQEGTLGAYGDAVQITVSP